MLKITNISGAELPLEDGRNLGPNQSIIVSSIPRLLHRVSKYLRIESVAATSPKKVHKSKKVNANVNKEPS